PHSAGVAQPTLSIRSVTGSGAGNSRSARRMTGSRGARRAARIQAVVALPSAPARYSVAPRLYQWAGSRGSRAARAAKESAAARGPQPVAQALHVIGDGAVDTGGTERRGQPVAVARERIGDMAREHGEKLPLESAQRRESGSRSHDGRCRRSTPAAAREQRDE